MNNASPHSWRVRCSALGLDPQELKSVSGRYDMYKSYTDEHADDTMELARWYKWYRVEKLSEGHGMLTPPAEGCSIGPDTGPAGPIVSEADFLELLRLYRRPDGARQS
jgi:hypothetical protein